MTYTDLAPGEHFVVISVSDGAGNITVTRVDFIVDGLPPNTVATLTPPANDNGWNSTDVLVAFTATDDSAVESITYSLSGAQSGGATVPGDSASVTITAPGTTTITYHATDVAARVEPTKQIVVRIDEDAPTAAITSTPSVAGVSSTCVSLLGCTYSGYRRRWAVRGRLRAAALRRRLERVVHRGCGVHGVWRWCDEPDLELHRAAVAAAADRYTVTAVATDLAGNVGPPSSASVLHVI